MERRDMISGLLVGLPALLKPPLKEEKIEKVEHIHDWVVGPFYFIAFARSREGDEGEIRARVEFCKDCGLVRMAEPLRSFAGKDIVTPP